MKFTKTILLSLLGFLIFLPGCGPNDPPRACFTADPIKGTAPLKVSFNAVCSVDDGHIVHFRWRIGPGGPRSEVVYKSGITASYTFPAYPGSGYSYESDVFLTVIDDKGATDTTRKTITVQG